LEAILVSKVFANSTYDYKEQFFNSNIYAKAVHKKYGTSLELTPNYIS